ncbi:MAG: carbohydrate porin [Candidatus Neomarinimicrobiota bacterium]
MHRFQITSIAIIFMVLLCSSVLAQDEGGITFEYGYTSDIMLVSGVDIGENRLNYLDNVDLVLGFDTEKLGLWSGGNLNIYFLSNQGEALTETVGDFQATSNIEADGTQSLYEFWYNQSLMDGMIEVLFGVHDLNSEFYTNEAAGLFTNGSFGIGADLSGSVPGGGGIFNMAAAAARVIFAPTDKLTILATVRDGDPGGDENSDGLGIKWDSDTEGMLIVAEGQYALSGEDDPPQVYRAGFWTHTAPRGADSDAYSGVYFSVDQPLGGIAAFVAGGIAMGGDADAGTAVPVPLYMGFGAHTLSETAGLFDDHAETLGLAVNFASIEGMDNMEIVVEATWAIEISDIFSIQPDVQFVLNPGGDADRNEGGCIVYGVRTSIGF